MKPTFVVALLIGLTATAYGLDLTRAKRSSNDVDPRIFDTITSFYNQVIHPPLNHIVTNLALLSAQALAGLSVTGIPTIGGSRSLINIKEQARLIAEQLWNQTVKPSIQQVLSIISHLATQTILGLNGASRIGKRDMTEAEMRGFFDDLWNGAIRPPVEGALSNLSLMLAQVLADVGINGVNLGKRDLTEAEMRGFFDDLWNGAIRPPVEDALSNLSLMLAQVLAGAGINGISLGKRDLTGIVAQEQQIRGFFDTLGQSILGGLQSVWSNIIQDPLEQALSTSALLAAQVLAGIGVNGVNLG